MNNTFSDHLPMPQDDDMPLLPRVGEVGPQVCATVQLYLGVMDDLTAEQVEMIQEHVRGCADCARVQRVMQEATQVFGDLPGSVPSSRVDEAVLAAIAAQGKGQGYIVGKDRTRRGGSGEEERMGPLGRPGSRRGGSGEEERMGPLGRPGGEEQARQPGPRATQASPPRIVPTPAPTVQEVRGVPAREGRRRVRLR